MSYPSPLQELVQRVNQTREQRLKQNFPRLSAEEKQALLEQFHPDYRTDTFTTIQVGPNAGDRTPRELASLIEGESPLTNAALNLDHFDYETDVLVIGGGGAGCAAAITADDHGARVIIAT
ncbi:MAG: FAD-binding protein, partial [candidate division WOR-3 bacterium]